MGRSLLRIGLKAKTRWKTRDPALDYTGGFRSRMGIIRKRIQRARIRAQRVGRLNKQEGRGPQHWCMASSYLWGGWKGWVTQPP
eukprot:6018532-Karenia_brevis.AAC.1